MVCNHFRSQKLVCIYSSAEKMTSAEASSAVAVAGSVCDDQTHVAVRLSDVADEDTPSDNKRPRLQDSTPDHQDVMGEENPDYPNEHRHY